MRRTRPRYHKLSIVLGVLPRTTQLSTRSSHRGTLTASIQEPSLQRQSVNMEAGRCHLCTFSLSYSRSLASPRKELVYMYRVSILWLLPRGQPLIAWLWWPAEFVSMAHKIITSRERVLNCLHSRAQLQRLSRLKPLSGKRPVSLSSQLQPEQLNTHLGTNYNPLQRPRDWLAHLPALPLPTPKVIKKNK